MGLSDIKLLMEILPQETIGHSLKKRKSSRKGKGGAAAVFALGRFGLLNLVSCNRTVAFLCNQLVKAGDSKGQFIATILRST